MPEYRTEPELDRGYSIIAIRSTLFHKNDRNALPVVIAYHCSSDVDVAVSLKQDTSTGEYAVAKYVRCTNKPSCYRAIIAFDNVLKNLELKHNEHRLAGSNGRVFYELTPDILQEIRQNLKYGGEPDSPRPTHTCPKCGHAFQD